jgi:hypothetical protein
METMVFRRNFLARGRSGVRSRRAQRTVGEAAILDGITELSFSGIPNRGPANCREMRSPRAPRAVSASTSKNHAWAMDLKSSEQLSEGAAIDAVPTLTPDERNVLYTSGGKLWMSPTSTAAEALWTSETGSSPGGGGGDTRRAVGDRHRAKDKGLLCGAPLARGCREPGRDRGDGDRSDAAARRVSLRCATARAAWAGEAGWQYAAKAEDGAGQGAGSGMES